VRRMDTTQLSQLIVALTGLITAVITLVKVLQHETIFRSTNDAVKSTNGAVIQATKAASEASQAAQSSQMLINTHLDALTAAAEAFAKQNLSKPPS